MADAYTTRNRGRKPESGQHNNVWAALANEDLISDRMDEALDGVQAYTLSANKTLTSTNGETDEARMRVQNITSGTGGYTVTIPAVEKWYIVRNASSGDATFSNGSNSVAVKSGNILPIFTNGTDIYQVRCLDYGTDLLKSDATPTLGVHVTNKTYVDGAIATAALGSITLAAGVLTWLQSGTSTDLRGALTDETGTGAAVFATAPTLSNPVVGTQTAGDNSTKAASTAYVDTAVALDIQDFTSSGTWTKPSTGTTALVEVWAPGGGGAAGRRGAAGSYRGGGSGGGGGGYAYRWFKLSDLASTETVTIGAAGTGAAATTANDTDGAAGVAGGNTTFSSAAKSLLAQGGRGGLGGSGSAVNGADGGSAFDQITSVNAFGPTWIGGNGSGSAQGYRSSVFGGAAGGKGLDANDANTSLGFPSYFGGGGGGAGGGLTTANTAAVGNAATGGDGNTAAAGAAGAGRCGGGGGGASAAGVGVAGGAAGGIAAGGGGGGASSNGNNAGAGGAGAPGFCRVTVF